MKFIYVFFAVLFGVMLGYGWQHYHNGLTVNLLKKEVGENQQRIDNMGKSIVSLQDEIILEQIVLKIIICESNGKHNAVGDDGKAFGPAQFHWATFEWMKTQADRSYLKWQNSDDQLWLLKWAIKKGYGTHWACYKNEKKKITF